MRSEARLQLDLCEGFIKEELPDLLYFNDLSAGLPLAIGIAMLNKRMQLTKAMPDLYILEPVGTYHGLVMELKADDASTVRKDGSINMKDKHIQEQRIILLKFREKGYAAEFSVGLEPSKDLLRRYLNGTYTPSDISGG